MGIRSARKKAGLTQYDIAEKLHVTVAAVSTWESGRSKPQADRLLALAQLCGCTMEELMQEDTDGKG